MAQENRDAMTLIFYHEKEMDSTLPPQSAVEIYRPSKLGGSILSRPNLDVLVKDFVSSGWRIDTTCDRLVTINPCMLSNGDSKPWRLEDTQILEMMKRGIFVTYSPFETWELEKFYHFYLNEVRKK
jgi:hypothetical protein